MPASSCVIRNADFFKSVPPIKGSVAVYIKVLMGIIQDKRGV